MLEKNTPSVIVDCPYEDDICSSVLCASLEAQLESGIMSSPNILGRKLSDMEPAVAEALCGQYCAKRICNRLFEVALGDQPDAVQRSAEQLAEQISYTK